MGERQEPRIIIIEKPGTNLDNKTERAFIDRKIKQLKKERGYGLLPFVIITLDKNEVEKAEARIKAKRKK